MDGWMDGMCCVPVGAHSPPPSPSRHRFKRLEKLSQQLLYQRAVAKKYAANTTFKGGKGQDPRKFELAKRQLRGTQDRIDDEQLRLKALAGELIKMEKMCVGALVIFEHRRSRERALRDYELYSNHLLPFVTPPSPLLFRGKHRLIVTAAPPPSDVVYENWETPVLSRAARRAVTSLLTLLLLVAALFIVVTLRAASNNVAAGADFDTDLCSALGDRVYQVGRCGAGVGWAARLGPIVAPSHIFSSSISAPTHNNRERPPCSRG